MAKSSRWKEKSIANGIWEIELSSWKYFHDYVRQEMLDYSHYVWRGQRDANWKLESSLDRLLNTKSEKLKERLSNQHLIRFQLASRGRRGTNPIKIEEENEWWALGQHHGLATPLLDWTESPFVALYFAFEKSKRSPSGKRAVWAIGNTTQKNNEIKAAFNDAVRPPILEMIRPHQDENSRLVNQSGLFTRGPLGVTVDEWIETNYVGHDTAPLIKLIFPESGRSECLRTLNKMNINHVTLFPDLYGASQHCNTSIQIDKY